MRFLIGRPSSIHLNFRRARVAAFDSEAHPVRCNSSFGHGSLHRSSYGGCQPSFSHHDIDKFHYSFCLVFQVVVVTRFDVWVPEGNSQGYYLQLSRRLTGISEDMWMAQAFAILLRLGPGDEDICVNRGGSCTKSNG